MTPSICKLATLLASVIVKTVPVIPNAKGLVPLEPTAISPVLSIKNRCKPEVSKRILSSSSTCSTNMAVSPSKSERLVVPVSRTFAVSLSSIFVPLPKAAADVLSCALTTVKSLLDIAVTNTTSTLEPSSNVAKNLLFALGVGNTAAEATGIVVVELLIPLDKVVSALFLKSNPTVKTS